jgi:thiol-disulfide isomerase/thioredoxin
MRVLFLAALFSIPLYAMHTFDNVKGVFDEKSVLSQKQDFILVQFWASWCATCAEAIAKADTWLKLHTFDVQHVGVGVDTSPRDALRYFNSKKKYLESFSSNLFLDPKSVFFKKYTKETGVPLGVLLNKEQKVVYSFRGHPNESHFAAMAKALKDHK